MDEFHKLPRLYTDADLKTGTEIAIHDQAHHYLRNVLRQEENDRIRLFNGRDGEYVGRIVSISKKNILIKIEIQSREQEQTFRHVHLLFTPMRKERLDWLIEKSVELGVTDLHPIITQNTDTKKINPDRIVLQIIEASEQCERLNLPILHDIEALDLALSRWNADTPLFAALERHNAVSMTHAVPESGDCAILIGPPGGFTELEKNRICGMDGVTPVTLGERILRSETAAIAALSLITLK